MIIEDKFVISRPRQEVWDFLIDIPRVSRCVPGVEEVRQIDGERFAGLLRVKVGPISASFAGEALLVESEPPVRLLARVNGKDKTTASMVSGTFSALLQETPPNQTEVCYQMDVAIQGRLGQFGTGVIRAIATQLTHRFVGCLEQRILELRGA